MVQSAPPRKGLNVGAISTQQRSASRHLWVAVLVLLLIAAFLLVGITLLHMHPDEELSYRSTEIDLGYTLWMQTSVRDNQAPLWFLLFRVWRTFVGDAELTSRVLSVLFSVLSLAVLYQIAWRGFGNAGVGVFAIGALLFNGFFFNYALDIRPYPLVMLTAALSVWAFQRWLRKGRRRDVVLYGLSIALLLYTHYLLIFLVVVEGVFLLIQKRWTLRRLGQLASACILGFLLWLPWFPTFINQTVGLRNIEAQSGTGRGIAGIGVSTQATSWATVETLLNMATNGMVWLYGLVILVGAIVLWRRAAYRLALLWALGVPVVALIANTIAAVYAPRFVSYLMLGLALALGAVFFYLPVQSGISRRYIAPVQAGSLLLFMGANLVTFSAQVPARVPYRDIYGAMSAAVREGDVVLFDRAGEEDGFVTWQYRHYMSPMLAAGITTDDERAASTRRVWYVSGELLTDPVQARFQALETTHPVQQAIGECSRRWCYVAQLMEAPPAQTPLVFGGVLPFFGVDVDGVNAEGIEARLWWKVESSPPRDYSIGLQLLDANGALVAQSDGPITHYGVETVQTSTMTPHRIYMDVRLVQPGVPLSAGAYTLTLVVYQSWDGMRLRLPNGDDALVLQRVMIP